MSKEIEILKAFKEEAKPIDVYNSGEWGFSRATFYRRLEKLKEQGLIEWEVVRQSLLQEESSF